MVAYAVPNYVFPVSCFVVAVQTHVSEWLKLVYEEVGTSLCAALINKNGQQHWERL